LANLENTVIGSRSSAINSLLVQTVITHRTKLTNGCVEDNGSEIPDVDDVESGSATSWTEVIKKKKKTDAFLGTSRMISHD
jgi:hypothetical protein